MNASEATTSHKLPEGAEDPDWIMRQQLQLLCRNTAMALGGTALCAVTLVALLWPVTAKEDLLAWLGMLMVLTLGRLLMQQGFLRRGDSDDPRPWQQIFAGSNHQTAAKYKSPATLPQRKSTGRCYMTLKAHP